MRNKKVSGAMRPLKIQKQVSVFLGVLCGSFLVLSCISLNKNARIMMSAELEEYQNYTYTSPQKIDLEQIVSIKAGGLHTVALDKNGIVWAWGVNSAGQLGIGTKVSQKYPQKITSLEDIIQISVGLHHTLALKRDGTVWAWGYNDKGQLGLGHKSPEMTPEQVHGITSIKAVFTGYKSSYAVQEDGSLWAWGENNFGQLGIGSASDQGIPKRVNTIREVSQVVGGEGFTFVLDSSGQVWSLGVMPEKLVMLQNDNEAGEAEKGNPFKIEELNNVEFIFAHFRHAFFIKNDGSVWAWGRNKEKQLGISSSSQELVVPSQLQSSVAFKKLAPAYANSFAIDTDGNIWAWGKNNNSEIGYSVKLDSKKPQLVEDIDDAIDITAGFHHVVALRKDGAVWTWGEDQGGFVIGLQ